MNLRIIPVLLLCAAAQAADYVQMTLKDGTVLVGRYDADTGQVAMRLGSVGVPAEQIASIDVIPEPEAPAAKPRKPEAAATAESTKTESAAAAIDKTGDDCAKGAKLRAKLAEALANPDRKAIDDGQPALAAARGIGREACRKMYKDANERLLSQWAERFAAQELSKQTARKAKADRALQEAQRALRVFEVAN